MERANAVYRERWDLDVRAMRVLRIIRAEPGITPKAVSQRALIEKHEHTRSYSIRARRACGPRSQPQRRAQP